MRKSEGLARYWRRSWTTATLAAALFGSACASEEPAPDPDPGPGTQVRAAFVYINVPGDLGWTYAHEQGRIHAQSALTGVETTRVENVTDDATSEQAIESLAEKGYDLIFTTSFGYQDPTFAVAQRYPEVKFEHCAGARVADNMSNYFGEMEQARYLTGIVAGRMSQAKKLGYVAAFPIPEVIRGINAFTLGVRSVNPDATVEVRWTNSWYDPAVEGQQANALLDTGADVLAQHQDSTATIFAARDRGAYAVGYDSDMLSFANETVLTSAIWHWGGYYQERIQAVKDGTWTAHSYLGNLESGMIDLGEYGAMVPQEVRNEVSAARAQVEAGTLDVFGGPLRYQNGTEWIPAGQKLTLAERLSMSEFVEGVVGDASP